MPRGIYPHKRRSGANSDPRSGPITRREWQVIDLIVDGHNNNSICNQLEVCGDTTKRHLQNIFAKLEVTNRTELAVKVLKQRHAEELKRVRESYFDFTN